MPTDQPRWPPQSRQEPKNSRSAKQNGRLVKSTIRLRTRACFGNDTPDDIETTWENPESRLISRLRQERQPQVAQVNRPPPSSNEDHGQEIRKPTVQGPCC